jgi:predicted RecA/RadA family phage recombinase
MTAPVAVFKSAGELVDYTPSGAVAAGDVVVQGDLVGVAPRAIAASALGALQVQGVIRFPKATGSSTALTAGAKVYWNASSEVVTTTSSGNKYVGKVVTAADDDDTTVDVRMEQ